MGYTFQGNVLKEEIKEEKYQLSDKKDISSPLLSEGLGCWGETKLLKLILLIISFEHVLFVTLHFMTRASLE